MWLAETHYPVGDAFPAVIVPEVVLLLAVHPRDDFQITFLSDSQQVFCILIVTFLGGWGNLFPFSKSRNFYHFINQFVRRIKKLFLTFHDSPYSRTPPSPSSLGRELFRVTLSYS